MFWHVLICNDSAKLKIAKDAEKCLEDVFHLPYGSYTSEWVKTRLVCVSYITLSVVPGWLVTLLIPFHDSCFGYR